MKTNDNKFPTIWSDPLGYSRRIANSKKSLLLIILGQIFFVIFPLYSLYEKTLKDILTDSFFSIFWLVIVFGCLMPVNYLYAIYRLIKIIDSNCPHCGNQIAPAGKPAFSPFIGKSLLVIGIIMVILIVIASIVIYLAEQGLIGNR